MIEILCYILLGNLINILAVFIIDIFDVLDEWEIEMMCDLSFIPYYSVLMLVVVCAITTYGRGVRSTSKKLRSLSALCAEKIKIKFNKGE